MLQEPSRVDLHDKKSFTPFEEQCVCVCVCVWVGAGKGTKTTHIGHHTLTQIPLNLYKKLKIKKLK